jgi:hypothetical protein
VDKNRKHFMPHGVGLEFGIGRRMYEEGTHMYIDVCT